MPAKSATDFCSGPWQGPDLSGVSRICASSADSVRVVPSAKEAFVAKPAQDTFAEFIGATVRRIEPGRTQAQLTIGPHHRNPHGTAHGGVLFSLAGVAIAASINDAETSGIVWAATIDYLAPAREGDELIADAVVERGATNQATVTVTVTRPADGVVVATASASAKVRARDSTDEDASG